MSSILQPIFAFAFVFMAFLQCFVSGSNINVDQSPFLNIGGFHKRSLVERPFAGYWGAKKSLPMNWAKRSLERPFAGYWGAKRSLPMNWAKRSLERPFAGYWGAKRSLPMNWAKRSLERPFQMYWGAK